MRLKLFVERPACSRLDNETDINEDKRFIGNLVVKFQLL